MKDWSVPENLLEKKFLSPAELKDALGISLRTVYRLIDSRKLPVFKVGNSLRFARDDVIEYLKFNRIDQLS